MSLTYELTGRLGPVCNCYLYNATRRWWLDQISLARIIQYRKMGSQRVQVALLFFIWGSLACHCLSYGIPSKYSVLEHELDKYPSEEGVIELFQKWKEEHRRLYRHPEEAALRLENFKRNLKYIVEKNAMRNSPNAHRLGLNRFADVSNEEFRRMYVSKVKKPIGKSNSSVVKDESCEGVPSSLDWRKRGVVTGVKDQGDCGKLANIYYCILKLLLAFI